MPPSPITMPEPTDAATTTRAPTKPATPKDAGALKPTDAAGAGDADVKPGESGDRASTPQGTYDLTPPGTLDRLAARAGVEPHELATLSVASSTPQPYLDVLEYAALCAPPTPFVPTQQRRHPLFIAPEDALQRVNVDDSDSDSDDEPVSPFFRMPHPPPPSSRLPIGTRRALAKKKAPVPKFKLALGETQITWPPPPELVAERLVAERDARSIRRAAKRKAAEEAAVNGGLKAAGDGEGVANGVAGKSAGEEVTEEENEGDAAEVKQTTIYMSHYSVSDPYPMDNGFETYRELLLACADGTEVLQQFTQEIMQWRIDKDHREGNGSKFMLQRFRTEGSSGYWESEGLKKARPAASVVLADGQMEAIFDDVDRFLQPACRKWYSRHGLPHRRSYLFYGPPGTGKTSTIRAIASKFQLNCCFLSMTNCSFSNQMLCDALAHIAPNALLVLEDVDALFNEDRKSENSASLTFSGMLNALDGVVSKDGVITMMTTNHMDRLDKALIRGGRVDRRFHFGHPTQKQIERLFMSFYPDDEELAKKFSETVFARPEGQEVRSIATLQQLFIQHRESSGEDCIKGIPAFCETHFPEGTSGKNEHIYS